MDDIEAQIADRLKQNLPKDYETDLAPTSEPDATTGQATDAAPYELDEITQYKLHDFFGEQYRDTNEENRQRVQYIYEKVADMVANTDYGFVISKIRDLEQVLGTYNSEDRLYRLYQWLKLENVRKKIDAEQGALRG